MDANNYTEKKRWSIWQLCRHWWHRKLSLRRFTVPPVTTKLSNWWSFVLSGSQRFASWWHHQMKTFSALLALCAGNHRSPVNSPHKGHWREALMFPLICAWINCWANNREAGDLRRHCAHYDVIVMFLLCFVVACHWSAFAISFIFKYVFGP